MNELPLKLLGKRVLIADDEESMRLFLRAFLEPFGVVVTEAVNGEEALRLYNPGSFELVLTDYAMPKMRGDALARAIKGVNPAQRVVMVSGFDDLILEQGKLPAFIDGLISKPCTRDQLSYALL